MLIKNVFAASRRGNPAVPRQGSNARRHRHAVSNMQHPASSIQHRRREHQPPGVFAQSSQAARLATTSQNAARLRTRLCVRRPAAGESREPLAPASCPPAGPTANRFLPASSHPHPHLQPQRCNIPLPQPLGARATSPMPDRARHGPSITASAIRATCRRLSCSSTSSHHVRHCPSQLPLRRAASRDPSPCACRRARSAMPLPSAARRRIHRRASLAPSRPRTTPWLHGCPSRVF
ncbi:hypothetical protein P171DRAFT_47068 [Karstenula rhodostoma CBS 690.94]|uniref:Uncharacterized protein n=1 Tax=Karstenula rhodostoma CBS 690.94 TaxID=1392251 RepID=A0A9P4PCS6_9PLEO|nr:hypothetical protein P171DRAFT_47068 [Karstenula rhodostoma CBS 690.94]